MQKQRAVEKNVEAHHRELEEKKRRREERAKRAKERAMRMKTESGENIDFEVEKDEEYNADDRKFLLLCRKDTPQNTAYMLLCFSYMKLRRKTQVN